MKKPTPHELLFFIGGDVILDTEQYTNKVPAKFVGFSEGRAHIIPDMTTRLVRIVNIEHLKPILRPISALTPEEMESVFKALLKTDRIIFGKINGYWAGTADIYHPDNENALASERLLEAEELDVTTVISMDDEGELAFGTAEDMRYFTGLEMQCLLVKELSARQVDVFGWIAKGWAVSKSKEFLALPQNTQVNKGYLALKK